MIEPRKALFIQLRRIGDILMCTPSVRAFKKKYPDCHLDFLTEHSDVLKGNPYLTELIDVDKRKEFDPFYQYKLIRIIRAAHYDLIVDFLANPRSAWYSYLSGASTRLSYGFGHRKWAYNLTPQKSDEPVYAAIDKLNLIKAIDIPADTPALDFVVSDDDRLKAASLIQSDDNRPLISLSPVSRREYRRWPLENFAMLGDIITEKLNANVLILAGPREDTLAARVCELMKNNSLVLKLESLGLLGAIFEKVCLHIGNDNGPKHIAVACGTPTLAIFGSDSPISWTYPDPSRHLYISPREYCPECISGLHQTGTECIKKIPVDAVWDKTRELITALNLLHPAAQK